jgi:dTDP-4-dehydrorhamnose reductase
MDQLSVLVLGDGLLGKEIVNQTGWNFLSRKKDNLDIHDLSKFNDIILKHNVILNCIACTDTYSKSKDDHWNTNVVFLNELIKFCNSNEIKLIHISTDYIYSGSVEFATEEDIPVHCNSWYGYTKLLGDGFVQLISKNYLLVRCSHKPKPFPYEKAWTDVVGNFDYVDEISKKIIQLIKKNCSGIYNIGTDPKSIFDLAKITNKDVGQILSPSYTPKNVTMNLNKFQKELIPFFSIAIPAYGYNGKGSDFLNFSFNILLSQKFKDFEIVVSDHSKDDTIEKICNIWSNHLNIKYFRNEKGRGIISPNLNNSLKNCRGKWIKILFQDDFLFSDNSLQSIKNFIEENPQVSWIASSFWHTNDGRTIYRRIKPSWPGENTPIWMGNNSIGCPSAITIKNESILYFDEELNWLMDCDYYQKMFLKFGEPKIHDEDIMINRVVEDRLTNTIDDSIKLKEYNLMYQKYTHKNEFE